MLYFQGRIGKVVCVYYLDWILSNTINYRLKIIILGGSAVLIYWFSIVFGYYIYPFSCRIFKAEFEILFVFTIQIVYYPILSIIHCLGGSALVIYWFSTVFGYYIYPIWAIAILRHQVMSNIKYQLLSSYYLNKAKIFQKILGKN